MANEIRRYCYWCNKTVVVRGHPCNEKAKVKPMERLFEPGCVFCAMFDEQVGDILQITPLNPIVEGHQLFIHRQHTADAGVSPAITAEIMKAASAYVNELDNANIITSKGEAATQSVFHTHIHVVPRRPGDGLFLPWSGQKEKPH